MEITLAERHWAAFWEEQDKTALQGWDGSAGAGQSGCGPTWGLHVTLFFPRTQEAEGFPVHAEPFVADESLGSGVSSTRQALSQDSRQTGAPAAACRCGNALCALAH